MHQDPKIHKNSMQRPSSLWHNRDYMLLWSGQTLSSIGTGISQLAFPLLILLLTNSPAQAGFAGALRTLPYVILCLPAGAFIDRWQRKNVMLLCDGGRLLSLASIPIALALGHLTVLQLYLNALIEGTLLVFFNLAETACLPRVVAQEHLATATAQGAVTGGISNFIGPLLGGLLYSLSSMLPFLVDAISFLCSFCLLIFIKTPFQAERINQKRPLQAEITEGLLWLWRQPLMRSLALLTGIVNFVFPDGSILLVTVIARQHKASAASIGLIFAIGSIAYILSSLLSVTIQRRVRFGTIIIGSCWLFALVWPLYAIVSNIFMLTIVTALLSLVDPIYDTAQFSRRAARIPDALQGRVNSAYRLIALASPPLGLALMGILLERVGVMPTVLVFSLSLLALAILATCNKHVRQEE